MTRVGLGYSGLDLEYPLCLDAPLDLRVPVFVHPRGGEGVCYSSRSRSSQYCLPRSVRRFRSTSRISTALNHSRLRGDIRQRTIPPLRLLSSTIAHGGLWHRAMRCPMRMDCAIWVRPTHGRGFIYTLLDRQYRLPSTSPRSLCFHTRYTPMGSWLPRVQASPNSRCSMPSRFRSRCPHKATLRWL